MNATRRYAATTALVVLRNGWVIAGSLPTKNGSVSGAGCLVVLDSHGVVRETFTGRGINGPWDMTALDRGNFTELFVTNVLNGTVAARGSTVNRGTVLRLLLATPPGIPPRLLAVTTIGSGLPEAGGTQVAVKTIDKNNGGAGNLFGLAVKPNADAVYFVDDFNNTLNLFH
jgi:hypothetical protein